MKLAIWFPALVKKRTPKMPFYVSGTSSKKFGDGYIHEISYMNGIEWVGGTKKATNIYQWFWCKQQGRVSGNIWMLTKKNHWKLSSTIVLYSAHRPTLVQLRTELRPTCVPAGRQMFIPRVDMEHNGDQRVRLPFELAKLVNIIPTHRIHVWYIYIYANIWDILMVNVTIYSIHGSYGQ